MEMLTGGTAAGDYDGDGLQDVFFTVYNGRSRLYRNRGDGSFEDVTVTADVGPMSKGKQKRFDIMTIHTEFFSFSDRHRVPSLRHRN